MIEALLIEALLIKAVEALRLAVDRFVKLPVVALTVPAVIPVLVRLVMVPVVAVTVLVETVPALTAPALTVPVAVMSPVFEIPLVETLPLTTKVSLIVTDPAELTIGDPLRSRGPPPLFPIGKIPGGSITTVLPPIVTCAEAGIATVNAARAEPPSKRERLSVMSILRSKSPRKAAIFYARP